MRSNIDLPKPKSGTPGRIVQSPIQKLAQDKREFWFEFHNFIVRYSVFVVLSLKNLKVRKMYQNVPFLIGRKRTVNFRNQCLWYQLAADYTILADVKDTSKTVVHDF